MFIHQIIDKNGHIPNMFLNIWWFQVQIAVYKTVFALRVPV